MTLICHELLLHLAPCLQVFEFGTVQLLIWIIYSCSFLLAGSCFRRCMYDYEKELIIQYPTDPITYLSSMLHLVS